MIAERDGVEVKECKRGGAGQLHTPAPAIAAPAIALVDTDEEP